METKTEPSEETITEEEALTRASNLKSIIMGEDDEVKALRQDGLTIDQIHEKYPHLSRAKIGRLVQGLSKKTPTFETKREIKRETNVRQDVRFDGDISQIPEPISHEISQDTSQHPSLPSGTLLFEQGDLEAIRNLIPKPHQATYIAHLDVVAKRQRLGHGNNGHGSSNTSYLSTENPYVKKLMEIAEAKEYKSLLGLDKNDHNDDLERKFQRLEDKIEKLGSPKEGNMDKTLDVLGKIYDRASGQNQGANPYQVARDLLDLTSKQANIAKGSPTNEYDLKHLEMHQLGQLENQKLAWEIEKYRDQKQSAADTITAIKDIFKTVTEGPVGRVLENLGGVAVRKIEGTPTNPKIIDVTCPSCAKIFKAIEASKQIACPFCSVVLQKQQPMPQAPEPQPLEPQAEAEMPKEPESRDVSTDAEHKKEKPEQLSEKREQEVIE